MGGSISAHFVQNRAGRARIQLHYDTGRRLLAHSGELLSRRLRFHLRVSLHQHIPRRGPQPFASLDPGPRFLSQGDESGGFSRYFFAEFRQFLLPPSHTSFRRVSCIVRAIRFRYRRKLARGRPRNNRRSAYRRANGRRPLAATRCDSLLVGNTLCHHRRGARSDDRLDLLRSRASDVVSRRASPFSLGGLPVSYYLLYHRCRLECALRLMRRMPRVIHAGLRDGLLARNDHQEGDDCERRDSPPG